MTCIIRRSALAALPWIALATFPVAALADEPETHSAAETLVRSALEAEVAGDTESRRQYLDEARAADGDFGPAHWHAGQMRLDDHWATWSEAIEITRAAANVQEYLRRREGAALTVADQLRIGHWCAAHDLPDSARAHFQCAVTLDPNSTEAHKALGHIKRPKGWISKEEIDAHKRARDEMAAAAKAHKVLLARLKSGFADDDPEVQALARDELLATVAPIPIATLEATLSTSSEAAAAAVVAKLAPSNAVEATNSLIRHAVFVPWPEVRQQAAKALESRPPHDWVPALLSGFEQPIELSYQYRLDRFSPFAAVMLYREGPFADEVQSIGVSFPPGDRTVETPEARETARRIESSLVNGVQAFNAAAQARNERIAAALTTATGESNNDDATSWYHWWYDYNEYPYPQERPLVGQATGIYLPSNHSCFLAGTMVTTWTGPQKIETIRVGDRVLAQDVDTGELAFKPVLATTLGPSTPMMKLTVSGSAIHLTRGHPVWVSGRGWRMAKELDVGDRLHALAGALAVDEIGDWAEAPTHNLVVADFNTYFVTDRQILVHDVTQRSGTNSLVPGLQPAGARR